MIRRGHRSLCEQCQSAPSRIITACSRRRSLFAAASRNACVVSVFTSRYGMAINQPVAGSTAANIQIDFHPCWRTTVGRDPLSAQTAVSVPCWPTSLRPRTGYELACGGGRPVRDFQKGGATFESLGCGWILLGMPVQRIEAYEPVTLQEPVDPSKRESLAELAIENLLDLPSTKRRRLVVWRRPSLARRGEPPARASAIACGLVPCVHAPPRYRRHDTRTPNAVRRLDCGQRCLRFQGSPAPAMQTTRVEGDPAISRPNPWRSSERACADRRDSVR